MAAQYKTPGVYIQEPEIFPPSVVGVETAIPCFIGYTERATLRADGDLSFIPQRLSSMAEFERVFGSRFAVRFYLDPLASAPAGGDIGQVMLGNAMYRVVQEGTARFHLYDSMRLFFANGGGACFVLSCGGYDGDVTPVVAASDILRGLAICETLVGPAMTAIPDAVSLPRPEFDAVTAATIAACAKTGDRMALLDVWGAAEPNSNDDWGPLVREFRAAIGVSTSADQRRYAAAYFPPLVTSVVAPDEVDIASLSTEPDRVAQLTAALRAVLLASYPATDGAPDSLATRGQAIYDQVLQIATVAASGDAAAIRNLTQRLVTSLPAFDRLLAAITARLGVLPTCGAIAGVWAGNDATAGVWNAPANMGIFGLIRPLLPVSQAEQEDLNVPVDGMAINAIGSFVSRGSLVWGARTLDGLDNDWRYIPVQRTVIYIEQSVKNALETFVSAPNTAQTWMTVNAVIDSFLHGLWASGGLMGSTASEAYIVRVGLGSTMTTEDVLEGTMRVQLSLALSHPAEFVQLSLTQQMLAAT